MMTILVHVHIQVFIDLSKDRGTNQNGHFYQLLEESNKKIILNTEFDSWENNYQNKLIKKDSIHG